MTWKLIKMWVSNPIKMYQDRKAVRQAELQNLQQWLIKENEARVAEGFPIQPMKVIKENAKKLLENREKSRPSSELEQIIKDLRAGKRLREQQESEKRRKRIQSQDRDIGR